MILHFRAQNAKSVLKVQKGALFSTLAPFCPPPLQHAPAQLWETSGGGSPRRVRDVSQTSQPSSQPASQPISASASAAGFLEQGVSVGKWEDAPPPLLSPQVGYLV